MKYRALSQEDDVKTIQSWQGFDAKWYVNRYLGGKIRGSAAKHYLLVGAGLGYNPGPTFDTRFYESVNDDVRLAGHNPLLHYLRDGRREGRAPLPQRSQTARILLVDHLIDSSLSLDGYRDGSDLFVLHSLSPTFKATKGDVADDTVYLHCHNLASDSARIHYAFGLLNLARYELLHIVRHRSDLGKLSSSNGLIKNRFSEDPVLQIAGPSEYRRHALAADYTSWLLHLAAAPVPKKLEPGVTGWDYFEAVDLWLRPSLLAEALALKTQISVPATPPIRQVLGFLASGQAGAFRLFEDLVQAKSKAKILTSAAMAASSPVKPAEVSLPVPPKPAVNATGKQAIMPTKVPGKVAPAPEVKLRGFLDLKESVPALQGWLAEIGDNSPRWAIVRFGSTEVRVKADMLRKDLQKSGINEGWHSFSVTLPSSVIDGKTREFHLIDELTGKTVAKRSCKWARPPRPYVNFEQFLASSMTQPLVQAPFSEEDKRCFAVMENIADRLNAKAVNAKTKPLVSVIMPIFNRVDLAPKAIASVLAQNYDNFELIAVDDGSSDGSVEVVAGIDDPRIKPVVLPENMGHSRARNAGLAKARGDIIAYLDSDNEWDCRYLGAIVQAFADRPDADAISSGLLLYRGANEEPYAMRFGHMNVALLENRNFVDLNGFAHRRKFLKKIKGFDETLRRFVDYDLVLRSTCEGTVCSVPVALVHYHFDRATTTVTKGEIRSEDLELVWRNQDERVASILKKMGDTHLKVPVSVVIPNWQSLDDIRDCIEALRARDWQGMLDIIVADNQSDEVVVEYLREEHTRGRIQLIENKDNMGFTYAVNQGIRAANPASDILILNNDAIMLPGSVQELQKAAYALPDAGMTVPRQILPAGTKTVSTHGPFANVQRPSDANLSAHHRNIQRIGVYHDGGPVELNYAPFFATYLRRSVIDEIGLLDAEFGRHYRSDRMYCDMMRSVTGKRIYYVPTAHAIHKLQKATDTLRKTDADTVAFELMFRRNQWSEEDRKKFNYRAAAWDTF